jgi:hypothetical protein
MSVQITEEDFKEYVKVQKSGKYNMFTEINDARAETDLSEEQWIKIMKHYKTFYEAWINNILKKKEDTNER